MSLINLAPPSRGSRPADEGAGTRHEPIEPVAATVSASCTEADPSAPSLHQVTVSMMAGSSRPGLLAIVSILHRRGAEVVEADLRRPDQGTQTLHLTISASPRRMSTVLASILREVDVLSADHVELLDFRPAPEERAANAWAASIH